MARQSFRLRRPIVSGDTVGVGSFVRGTSALQTTAGASSLDQDAAIRSTDIIAVVPTSPESVFEAIAIEYNAVLLDWTLTEAFSDIADIGVGESGIVNVAIVYSKTGYPQTVTDGKLIYQGTANSYLHQEPIQITTDQGIETTFEPETGKWAYYSLFAYFNTEGESGTYYYQLLAQLEIIVPKDYGSRGEMWKRIPTYYREQDISNNNQLYRFIDTFGFELDRSRTLIDTMMVQYDPLLAEAEAIGELATMLGLELNVADIGVSRTRALLHDIGHLRRNKGTLQTTEAFITAVGGSDVTLFTGASAPYYTFAVHAERSNLIADPRFAGVQDSTWSIKSDYPVTVSTAPSEGITITAGSNNTYVALLSNVSVPTSADNTYYMSAEYNNTSIVNYGGYWGSGASWYGAPTTVSRTNLLTNPNFETNTTGWGAASGATNTRTSAQSVFGSWSISQTRTSTTGDLSVQTSPRINVTGSTAYTFSTYFRRNYSTTRTTRLRMSWYDSGGVIIGTTLTSTITPPAVNTWGRFSMTATAPSNAATVFCDIIVTSAIVGETIFVDGALLEASSSALPYFDGTYVDSYGGYIYKSKSWSGTANGSTSTAVWDVWPTTTAGASIPVGVIGRAGYAMADLTTNGSRYPVSLFKIPSGQSVTVSRWMVEPNKVGQFFDGDTVFGGFLYQGFSSDYLWSGTDQASYSTYTTNRKKTQDAIGRLLPQILPVTMLGTESGQPKYQVMFDWIPGKTL